MTDTVAVTRASGEAVTDPESGVVTHPTTPVYSGRGRVQGRDVQGQESDSAGQFLTAWNFILQVPVTVDLQPGDSATVTASADPLMVGRVFHVESVPRKTHMTALRAGVEEVTA